MLVASCDLWSVYTVCLYDYTDRLLVSVARCHQKVDQGSWTQDAKRSLFKKLPRAKIRKDLFSKSCLVRIGDSAATKKAPFSFFWTHSDNRRYRHLGPVWLGLARFGASISVDDF